MTEAADQAENSALNNFKRMAGDFGRINRNFNRVKGLLQGHKRWLRGASGEVANGRITQQRFAEDFTKILRQNLSLLAELEKDYSALEKEAERVKQAAQLQAQQSPRSFAAVDISFETLLVSEEQRAEGAKRTISAIAQQLRTLEQQAIATAGTAAGQNAIERGFDNAYNALDRLHFLIQRDMRRMLAFYKQQVKEYLSERKAETTAEAYQHVSVAIGTNDIKIQQMLNAVPPFGSGWNESYVIGRKPFPMRRSLEPQTARYSAPVEFYHGKLAIPVPPLSHYMIIAAHMGLDGRGRLGLTHIYIVMPEAVYKAATANNFGGVEGLLHAVLPAPLFEYIAKMPVRYASDPQWWEEKRTIFTAPRTYSEQVR